MAPSIDRRCRKRSRWAIPRSPRHGLLGRSQAVRQRILIPPFGGSIPPAPATHSGVRQSSRIDARIGPKSGLFARSPSSLNSRFGEPEGEFAESLRPYPQIFPFCGDYRRRPVRSSLPPDLGTQCWPNLRIPATRVGNSLTTTRERTWFKASLRWSRSPDSPRRKDDQPRGRPPDQTPMSAATDEFFDFAIEKHLLDVMPGAFHETARHHRQFSD